MGRDRPSRSLTFQGSDHADSLPMTNATRNDRTQSPDTVAARRLASQRLVGPGLETAAAAVSWLGAVQAQDYTGAKWALGMRAPGTTDGDVEAAFSSGAILRTHVLRPTWHFVAPADIRWLLSLTAPRVQAANAYMYRKLGLDATTLGHSATAMGQALEGGQHLTRDDLRLVLGEAGIRTDGELRMGYIMMHAELEGIVCSGPRRGNVFTYALLDERVPPTTALDRDDALGQLASRYFVSRGPATVHDFAKWSGLTVTDAKRGVAAGEAQLEHERIGGASYWFARPEGSSPKARGATAHLLSIYDEYVSGYKDRSAIGDAQTGTRLSAMGNALTAIVVIDGRIRGTWKRTTTKAGTTLHLDLFDDFTRRERSALEEAAAKYGEFLRTPVTIE